MLETIKIKADTELGYMVINLIDYDTESHAKYYPSLVEIDGDVETTPPKKTRSKRLSVDV